MRRPAVQLVEGCPAQPIAEYRRRNPDHVIVSYINTSADVKAESDIICTSRNAVKVVNSIPADKTILFLPDRNLGAYVKKQTGRREHEDLAGRLHRACDISVAAFDGDEGGASGCRCDRAS